MYQSISLYAALGWLGLLAVCIALNELCRLNKWFSLLMFLVLPAILTFNLWPQTAVARRVLGSTVIGGMLAASGIAIFLIPVTFYVVERLATGRKSVRAENATPPAAQPATVS